MALPFDNTYARLPERFFARQEPTPVKQPRLLRLNTVLAQELGLDATWLAATDGVAALAGNAVPTGAEPIAQAYAGHQFAHFVPQLGDGRALLLGEIVAPDGRRFDVQLKGAGPTPWSRRGDGRSALGPVLREYLVSEAMHALGVPTTRALAAVASGQPVWREEQEPGGIFTRVAASHLRVGTFQYFASRNDIEALRVLVDYTIDRHYPAAAEADRPALALLEAVITAQARLIPQWLGLGFIHGVMNTDNCALSGETIDYGPCAFMDAFHPACVFSSIDRHGRYAWGQQPTIAQWNLTRFAETLLPLIDNDKDHAVALAEEALKAFFPQFEQGYLERFSAKFGLARSDARTPGFIKHSLETFAGQEIDFTLGFRYLTRLAAGEGDSEFLALWPDETTARDWLETWRSLAQTETRLEAMRAVNPVLIPRNHRVAAAIRDAYAGDYTTFDRLAEAWTRPYAEDSSLADLEQAPSPEERVTDTFCGT
jgi:uncharacterized protein YdiU (UPF0061 family)